MSRVLAEIVCEVVIPAPVTPKSIREAVANAIGGPDALHERDGAYSVEIEAYVLEHRDYGADSLCPDCVDTLDPASLIRTVTRSLAGMVWGASTQVSRANVEVWQRGRAPSCYLKLSIQKVKESDNAYQHIEEVCGWTGIGTCPVCGGEEGRIL